MLVSCKRFEFLVMYLGAKIDSFNKEDLTEPIEEKKTSPLTKK